MYKINIDGAFSAATSQEGWGFVARNNVGDFLKGGCGNLCRVATSFQAKALATLHSL
jgi:ribonuclease HI